MAGDIASAWETFGWIAMQLTHLIAALNLEITENATIAMTCDQKIRTYANELSIFRTRGEDIMRHPFFSGGARMTKGGWSFWTRSTGRPTDRFPRLVYAERYLNKNSIQFEISTFCLGKPTPCAERRG